MPVLLAEGAFT
jgi:hypothetical protein